MLTTYRDLGLKAVIPVLFFLVGLNLPGVYAQEKPPRPIHVTVSNSQGIVFGSFVHGASGGWVSVSPTGSRSSGGDVVLLSQGSTVSPAIFLVEGIKGTLITISNIPNATLTGSNGGSMTLTFDLPNVVASTGSPFVLNVDSPATMEVRIGGKLLVSNSGANPPGNYSGNFIVTFNQQ